MVRISDKDCNNNNAISESTDYSILFYIVDGALVTVAVLSFWIRVSMRKSPLTTKESLKKIWTKAPLVLFSFLFIMGAVMGVKDTYVVPYLSDDLGASSQLISELKLIRGAGIMIILNNYILKVQWYLSGLWHNCWEISWQGPCYRLLEN